MRHVAVSGLRLIPMPLLLVLCAAAAPASAQAIPATQPHAFVHPGLLHTRADLDRIRQAVAAGREPWKSGFEPLRRDFQSRADYELRGPCPVVTRERGNVETNSRLVYDADAAYQNALMWCITGDAAHARKAVQILNAWSGTLQKIQGHDVQLAAGLDGFKLVNAAELIRYTYDGWEPQDIARFERMLREVIYPPIKDFATFANGNWDAICMETMIAIGVFCDDRALFDRAVEYYRHGSGNGRLTNYIFNEAGQCQETGRDQQHTQLGLGALADTCEIAWNQGVDLYGEADNRLLKGFEYTARYNLGYDVPFVPHVDTTGKYRHKQNSPMGRGRLRPIWEMVWNHYENRQGVLAPYTKEAAERARPESAGFGADHPGFGTLLFSLPADCETEIAGDGPAPK